MFPYYDPININKISYTRLSLKKNSEFDLERVTHKIIVELCNSIFILIWKQWC